MTSTRIARTAGLFYLILIACGIFAEFFVRESLKVPGDPAATASHLVKSESLFRAGIAADLIMIVCDISLALLFYMLFKSINEMLSMLSAFFRLIQAATLSLNLNNLVLALNFAHIENADAARVVLFLDAHSMGYAIALVFFGMSILFLGYLIWKSGLIPKIFGVLLFVAAVGYLVDSFARVMLTDYDSYADVLTTVVFLPAFISELALSLWLLIKGASGRISL